MIDDDFVPISAADFVSGSKSAFDVFVKLAPEKYLKLLEMGDQFCKERIESYLTKGVKHFYIKKEAQEIYLRYQQKLALAMLASPTISLELKVTQAMAAGEEVANFMKKQGVTAENMHYASTFVSGVNELVKKIATAKSEDALSGFLSNLGAYDHGVGTSMMAGVLSHVLEIRMERPTQIVGLACLFHDIGLYQLPENLWHEDESKMSADEKVLYRTHPKKSVEMLSKIIQFEPAALQAIEQHHRRLNGLGFSDTESGQLTKVAEIVGICQEFQIVTKKLDNDPSFPMLTYLESQVFPGFSRQIVYAFRTSFFPKKT